MCNIKSRKEEKKDKLQIEKGTKKFDGIDVFIGWLTPRNRNLGGKPREMIDFKSSLSPRLRFHIEKKKFRSFSNANIVPIGDFG